MSDQPKPLKQPEAPFSFLTKLWGKRGSQRVRPLLDMMATLMTSTYDLNTLVNSSLEMLKEQIQASYIKIVLIDREETLLFNSVGHHAQKMYPNDIPRIEALLTDHFASAATLEEGELKKWMQSFELSLIFKLEVRGTRVGYLFVGKPIVGPEYPQEVLDTLSIVVEQLAVAFANALAVRRISAFNEELKAEVEKATQKLATANEELKELDKLKDEFVSMASHELKSPLNAVKNFLWLAITKGKEEPEKLDTYLQTAHKATEQVLYLVNDLLDVSRIESGRVQLKPESLSLRPLVEEITPVYQSQIKAKSLTLTLEIEGTLMIKADKLRIQEVLANLISNAVKYTLAGGITIKATTQGELVRCEVNDTGVGIKKEDQAKLFEKFIRLNASYKELATVEGTGLGLYITRKLVELMGGTIGIESQEGKGSSFWFTVPRA